MTLDEQGKYACCTHVMMYLIWYYQVSEQVDEKLQRSQR